MTVKGDLAALNQAFSEALADQDAAGVTGYYTDDARLLFSGVPIIRGRDEILAAFEEDLKDGPSKIRFESGEILEGGALVVDVGSYITPTGRGKYVVVYQRQADGTLKIAVDAANSDGAASSSPV